MEAHIEGQTGDLQFEIVLIGPEPRHFVDRCGCIADRMRRESRLLQGIGHTLEPPGSLVELQRPPRAIADRKDPRIARSRLLIDHDPVITWQPAAITQLLVRNASHTY